VIYDAKSNDLKQNTGDDKACASIKLDPFALKITKTGAQSCQPGGQCSFELDIFNPGPILHDDPVTVVDNLTGISGAEIVSITQVSGNDAFPCSPAPTKLPFSCTGHMRLEIDEHNKYMMVVKLPADAAATGSFSNCASVAGQAGQAAPGPAATGGTPSGAQSCHQVSLGSACTGGMELMPSGQCACPSGTKWDGRSCATPSNGSGGINTTAPQKPAPAPVPQKPKPAPQKPPQTVCPPDKPGKYPNCCDRGFEFRSGACRCPRGTNLINGVCQKPPKPPKPEVCPKELPIGTYPNCCPRGHHFRLDRQTRKGSCVPDQCPPGTVGRPPICLPQKQEKPERDCGPGYRELKKPNKYGAYCEPIDQGPPKCPDDRPNGTPPNCCPPDTRFTEGQCYPTRCSPGWTGSPPHCQPPQAPPPPPPKCAPPKVGTPPNCVCPARRSGPNCEVEDPA